MERSNFFNDQLVVDSDLNNIETTTASQIIKRAQAVVGTSGGIGHNVPAWVAAGVVGGGIFGSPADYLTSGKNFFVAQFLPNVITVDLGIGMDVNGNLIYIPSQISIGRGSTTSTTNWTSSPSVTNYVKLSYRETSGSVKANDAGAQFYTRYAASYFVNIDSVAPLSTEILLATFVADGGGSSQTPFTDRRTYVRTVTTADAVILDPTTKVVSTINTLYDHAQAIGTGTPTATNPHGLSAADIGFTVPTSSITEHRQSEHVSGILLHSKSATSFQSYSGSLGTPVGGFDVMQFTVPTDAVITVGGNIISGPLPAISTQTAPANGMFYICATNLGVATFVSASVLGGLTLNNTENDPHGLFETLLPLTLVQITGAAHDTIASATDVRRFYGMSPYDVRPDFSEPVSNVALLDTVSKINSLVDNLARMRYQIGIALNGTGSLWTPGSPNPLTGGPASNADLYHTHASITPFSTGSVYNAGSTVRQVATQYQNNTGGPLYASVVFLSGGGTGANASGATILAYTNPGFTSGSVASFIDTLDSSTAAQFSVNIIVPPTWYYQVTIVGSPAPSMVSWSEIFSV